MVFTTENQRNGGLIKVDLKSISLTIESKNIVTGEILDSCIEVHRRLGPGLLESTYETCLMRELESRGLKVLKQVSVPIFYKGIALEQTYKIDILVEDEFIIELKSVETILPVHKAQIMSYLKLAGKPIGFLVNFNVPLLKEGFHRFIVDTNKEFITSN